MERIASVIGQPPDNVLEQGILTGKHFKKRSSSDPTEGWVLKSSHSTERPQGPSMELHDLLKSAFPIPTKDQQAVECDRLCFIDLVQKMLLMDASERITPEEILSHPFINLSHLNHQSYDSYVKSSIDCMKVCNNWSLDGGENVQRLISNTPNTSNAESNTLIMEHPLNSEEEPSVPDVFIRGETGSPKGRHVEDLNRSVCQQIARAK